MAAGMMTREDEVRVLSEFLDLYRNWIRGVVAEARLDGAQTEPGRETIEVDTEALDVWMAALDKTADRMMMLTGAPELLARIGNSEPIPPARPPAAQGKAAGRPALRLVT